MEFIETEYTTYIKPHLCAFLFTAIGVSFATPMLRPMVSGIPVFNQLSGIQQDGVLAGGYALTGSVMCSKFGWFM